MRSIAGYLILATVLGTAALYEVRQAMAPLHVVPMVQAKPTWTQQLTTWDGGRITIVTYEDAILGPQKHIIDLDN